MSGVMRGATLKLTIGSVLLSALDLSTADDPLAISQTNEFANGTGANQASNHWHDTRTLSASASENIDLAGSLTNVFGVTLTFTKVKALFVKAAAANTNNVLVARGSSNGFVMFSAASDEFKLTPGAWACFCWPDANGVAVTAGTGDILTVTNSSSGTSVTYDIYILGVD